MLIPVIQTGCVGFYGTRSTYGGQDGAEVNGARVSMSVKPEGTSGGTYALSAIVVGVAIANLDGPFRWRIEAEGKEGIHEAMYVQRLRIPLFLFGEISWWKLDSFRWLVVG